MCEFTPILKLYDSSEYKQNESIKKPMSKTPIWEENFSRLPLNSRWDVKYNGQTGNLAVTRSSTDDPVEIEDFASPLLI